MKVSRALGASLLLVGLSLLGCAQKGAGPAPDVVDDPRAPSLYDLPIKLTDQTGAAVRLDDFRGHPVLITMFYGECPHACPMLISDLKAIVRDLDPETRAATRVLLVTFDPARDTPEALRQLAAKHRVDLERWRFASASDADVRTLAAALDIKYRRLPDGGYNHSSLITLLDARGVIVAKVDGLQQPSEALRARAKTVAQRR